MTPSLWKRFALFEISWKIFVSVRFEFEGVVKIYYKMLEISIFVELENQSILEKHSNHFKNIKNSLKNDLLDK